VFTNPGPYVISFGPVTLHPELDYSGSDLNKNDRVYIVDIIHIICRREVDFVQITEISTRILIPP
jgi:hypothetical protein